MARVFEREVVQDAAIRAHQRKHVEDRDGPRMTVEELAEVGLPDPAVDAVADFDAHVLGYGRRLR